jgi:hypothetical protein
VTVSKTASGAQVMKDRSVSLSAQQRSALILCDGKRSAEEVVRMTAAVGVTLTDIQTLETLGLVDIAATPTAAIAVPALAPAASAQVAAAAAEPVPLSSAEGVDFRAALNAAIMLCSNIGFKGFSLNMALTGVDSIEKLQKLAPEIRRAAGDAKYKPLHTLIFGQPL